MKKSAFLLLLISYALNAQKMIYRRSNGDLLTGTWICVKCKDTTVQTINFRDTVFTKNSITPEGIRSDTCSYKVKKNKVFIRCNDGKGRRRYRIVLIDINSLELKQWNRNSEEFKKSL